MDVYTEEVAQYEYDPEKAKALLAKAGYPDGFTFKNLSTSAQAVTEFQQFQIDYLSQVGINMEMELVDTPTFNQRRNEGSFDSAKALGIPVVRNTWMEPLDPYDIVSGTDHEAGSAVARYLVELGHRKIVYVHGAPGYRGRIERFYGVREVLERHSDVTFRELRFQAEMRFTEHLKAAHDTGFLPTAFFCAHDGLAVTVVSELLRLGYRIPEDVPVIGFGDYSAATQISPQLTTVRVHGRQIGSGLVRLLDDKITGRIASDYSVRMMIASHLIVRESTGPMIAKP